MASSLQRQGRMALWQRALLPSEAYESRDRRSTRDWIVDGALFLAALGAGLLALNDLWSDHSPLENALDLALGSAACLALWVRRSKPIEVAVFATAASAFFIMASGAALISIFNAAVRGRGRGLGLVVLVALAASVTYPLVNPETGPILHQSFPGFMATAIAFGWGLFVRVRRELIVSLRERAKQLEIEKQQSVTLAREAERRRIAREMHDVLAHRLSLLSVHAGALEFRPNAPAGEIAQAAAVIRRSAAAALAELRDVISVLREDASEDTEPPQPTLVELPDLLDESRAAGMTVRAYIDVAGAASLPEAHARTAYRIVQEGLTNARKHAPGAPVEVKVSTDDGTGLLVEVVSRPTDGVSATPARATAGAVGLIGLGERVTLAGGELEHGTNADGDFVLRASIPSPR